MTPAMVVRRLVRGLVLIAVWVALWGDLTAGNVVSGVLVVVGIDRLFPGGPDVVADDDEGTLRPLATLRFVWVFAGALLGATWQVVVAALRPRLRIAEGIVAVPLVSRSPVIATFVANAISLTPGTLTVEVSPPRPDGSLVLYVHALDVGDPETVRSDGRRFEGLAVAAFGSRVDRARWKERAA
jgi:multicomponent Na+:H+ antiporter subunit E